MWWAFFACSQGRCSKGPTDLSAKKAAAPSGDQLLAKSLIPCFVERPLSALYV